MQTGTLYVVATPIGNLGDITYRARDVLSQVAYVAAEDTRHTRHLLSHLGLNPRLLAVHEHNEQSAAQRLIPLLQAGASVALVSDAGTPGVSDPGARVVAAVREAGFPVVTIPGPSALTAALSLSGFTHPHVLFYGFLPPKAKARESALEALRHAPYTLVFYEAPHRIRESLADLARVLGAERRIALCKELTKTFETVQVSSLEAAQAWLAEDAAREKGEFVLIVEGVPPTASPANPLESGTVLRTLLTELPLAQAAKLAAALTGESREALYQEGLALRKRGSSPGGE